MASNIVTELFNCRVRNASENTIWYISDFGNYSMDVPSSPNNGGLKRRLLEVPLSDKDELEVPIAVCPRLYKAFDDSTGKPFYDNIILDLYASHYSARYSNTKAIAAVIRNVFDSSRGLIRLNIGDMKYYCTNGIILDRNFKPIMMACYKVHKAWEPNGHIKFDNAVPILRIDPSVYGSQKDVVKSYIINKFIKGACTDDVYITGNYTCFHHESRIKSIRIIIDSIPYRILEPLAPNIRTSSDGLKDIVIRNLDLFKAI